MDKAEEIFIEWYEKQEYSVKKIIEYVIHNGELTDNDADSIINDYIDGNRLKIDLDLRHKNLSKITLLRLHDVKGVNKLKGGQVLEFDKHLTLVYGENGTGKTGYSRIIQHVGKFMSNKILPIKNNVFENTIVPTAEIDYIDETTGKTVTLNWNENKNNLLNIKLFNTSCVGFSLGPERAIDFTPYIFRLCNNITIAIEKFKERVTRFNDTLANELLEGLINGTNLYALITNALETNQVDAINKYLSELNIENIENEIEQNKKESDSLNTGKILADNKILSDKINEIERIINEIKKSSVYSFDKNKEYHKNISLIKELKENTNVDDLLNDLNVSEKLKDSYLRFLTIINSYYLEFKKHKLSEATNCLLCGRPLKDSNNDVSDIFVKYGEILKIKQSDKIEKLEAYNKKIDDGYHNLIEKISTIYCGTVIQNNSSIKDLVEKIIMLLRNYHNENISKELECKLNELVFVENELSNIKEENKKKVSNLDKEKDRLIIQLNNLNMDKLFIQNNMTIINNVKKLITIKPLLAINGMSLGKCLKNIQDKVYKKDFIDLLNNTLKELRAPEEVRFTTKISASKMKIKQGYYEITKDNQLNDVLSEGEQTVVALAQFIAESKFNNDNVLFFDDPVNSLDLKRMEVIAKALVKLAKEKQVVIFTHNLVFIGFIKTAIEQEKELKEYKFYQTSRTFENEKEYVGKLEEIVNPNTEKYSYYEKELNKGIEKVKRGLVSVEDLRYLYGCIRSGIEMLISDKIFNGTIQRYKPDISVMRFAKINVDELIKDQEPIIELYERSCRFIVGHSSPQEAKMEVDAFNFIDDANQLINIAKKYKQK